jgi:DNA topoisomerase-1
MGVAQTLYENGFITYMRTDSTTLSDEALNAARNLITREFGKEYLYDQPRIYKTKVKNAQEAHEAIRPAGSEFTHPSTVKDRLGVDAFRLYELIWKRTLASQMRDAQGTRVLVSIAAIDATFRASGRTISFPGYLRAYVEGSDDPEGDLADQDRVLPPLVEGEGLKGERYEPLKHSTQPPARFTEGSLIKELERLGIGRPSTWATIVDVVLSRDYAFKKGSALVPSFLAIAVTGLLEGHFSHLVDYEFTAKLEDDLDSISRGELDNLEKLRGFYFGDTGSLKGLKDLVTSGEETIDPREVCGIRLGIDTRGRAVEVRIGRYGPFLSNGEDRSALPDSLAFDELTVERAEDLLKDAGKAPESLGTDPLSSLPVYLKKGRFGPYVQLGDAGEGKEKPKMASLLPGMSPEGVTLDVALELLKFPKQLGVHPDNNGEILVANGRYGPYVKCGSESRSIPADESPLYITLERALELLKQPRQNARAASQPKTLKELGKNPESSAAVQIKSGRYGPYVTDGTTNASLQRGADPDTLTLDEALALLKARAEMGPPKKRGRSRGASRAEAKTTASKTKSKASSSKKRGSTKASVNDESD